MSTFATNSALNDLYLDDNNNIAIYTDQLNEIKQKCNNNLKTILSEVFIDNTIGVDWFGILLSEDTTMQDKINEISKNILNIDGVLSIQNISYQQDKNTREITFIIDVLTEQGIITINDLVLGV